MEGLDRGFELVAPRPAHTRRARERRFRFGDRARVPQRAVLIVQGHETARRVAPRAPARFGEKHRREQAERFRLAGRDVDRDAAQKQRFGRQVGAARIGAERVVQSGRVGGVDRFEHARQPWLEIFGRGQREGDARVADLDLGAA